MNENFKKPESRFIFGSNSTKNYDSHTQKNDNFHNFFRTNNPTIVLFSYFSFSMLFILSSNFIRQCWLVGIRNTCGTCCSYEIAKQPPTPRLFNFQCLQHLYFSRFFSRLHWLAKNPHCPDNQKLICKMSLYIEIFWIFKIK